MSTIHSEQAMKEVSDNEKLSSEDLAALVVDALLRADVVSDVDVPRAIAIAREEIEARKAVGDY
jgi:hypothetical protein